VRLKHALKEKHLHGHETGTKKELLLQVLQVLLCNTSIGLEKRASTHDW